MEEAAVETVVEKGGGAGAGGGGEVTSVHDRLERVFHWPGREQLSGRDVEAAQVVLDVVADARERRLVKRPALADERRLLEQRLGLAHLLKERKVDRFLLLIERRVRVARQDGEEQPDDGEKILDELRVVGLEDADRP